jgi:hypothetical protein
MKVQVENSTSSSDLPQRFDLCAWVEGNLLHWIGGQTKELGLGQFIINI